MSDLLGKLKKLAGNLQHKEVSVLGVDVSSSSIKVVQLRRDQGKAVLETYGELALGPYAGVDTGRATKLPVETMASALKDLMTEARVTTTASGIAMPLRSSLINVIPMPDLGEKKLKEMVPIEMRKYIPVSISEVMLDWRIIPSSEREESVGTGEKSKKMKMVDVLVVAIHKETINRFQNIIKQAALDASFFEIEVFSTIRASLAGGATATLILDMGASSTKLYIVEHRVLRQSHTINRGAQDITLALSRSMGISHKKAEEFKRTYGVKPNAEQPNVSEVISLVLDNILAEAHRVMLGYQKKYHSTIDEVLLAGGGAGLEGFTALAQKVMQVDVRVADPFAKVESPAFLDTILQEAGPEFAVAVGVALRKLEESS